MNPTSNMVFIPTNYVRCTTKTSLKFQSCILCLDLRLLNITYLTIIDNKFKKVFQGMLGHICLTHMSTELNINNLKLLKKPSNVYVFID